MGLFNRKDKYNIDKKSNIPQLVYGIPDFKRNEKAKKDNTKTENIFYACFKKKSEASYYYINRSDNSYQFLYGHTSNGDEIKNDINNSNIKYINKDEKYYNMMLQELTETVTNWNEKYNDASNIDDEIKWNIDIIEKNKKFSGYNSFPDDFGKAVKIIEKYFEELI